MKNFYKSICANAIDEELYFGEENKDNIYGQRISSGFHKVTIHNARLHKHPPDLKHEEFCILQENSAYHDFDNQDKIKNIYFPIIRDIIKKHLMHAYSVQNLEVYIFQYFIRNEISNEVTSELNRTPANLVHADYSSARLDDFYNDKSKEYLFKNSGYNHKKIIGNNN
jgi:hypothetical protein